MSAGSLGSFLQLLGTLTKTFKMDAAVVQVSKPVVITRHEDLSQSSMSAHLPLSTPAAKSPRRLQLNLKA